MQKKYSCVGISSQQLLRTGENVSGIGKNWIIISEKYLIKYDSNTTDEVKNMPSDQVKFWNENIKLSSEGPEREKYIIDTKNIGITQKMEEEQEFQRELFLCQ